MPKTENQVMSHRIVRSGNDWRIIRNAESTLNAKFVASGRISNFRALNETNFATPKNIPSPTSTGVALNLPERRGTVTYAESTNSDDEFCKEWLKKILSPSKPNRVSNLGMFDGNEPSTLSTRSSTKDCDISKSSSAELPSRPFSFKDLPNPSSFGRNQGVKRSSYNKRDAFAKHCRELQHLTNKMYPELMLSSNVNAKENGENYESTRRFDSVSFGGGDGDVDGQTAENCNNFIVNPKYSSVISRNSYTNELRVESDAFQFIVNQALFETSVPALASVPTLTTTSSFVENKAESLKLNFDASDIDFVDVNSQQAPTLTPPSHFAENKAETLKFNLGAPEVGFVNSQRENNNPSNALGFSFKNNDSDWPFTPNPPIVQTNDFTDEWTFSKAPAPQRIVWSKPPPINWFND